MPGRNEMIRDEYDELMKNLKLSETSVAHIDVMYDSDERAISVKNSFDNSLKKACETFGINEFALKEIIEVHCKTIGEEIMMLIQSKEKSIW